MSTYAANTDVSADKSRAEIERTLRRYGADGFMYGWETNRAVIGFTMNARQVRFVIGMPDPNERRFTHTEARGAARNPDAAYKAVPSKVPSGGGDRERDVWRIALRHVTPADAGAPVFEERSSGNRPLGNRVEGRLLGLDLVDDADVEVEVEPATSR